MTSNPFLALAQALTNKHGDDMEDIAHELAAALKEIISDGLGTTNHHAIKAEVAYLMHFTNDTSHRPDSDASASKIPDPDQF